MKSHVPADTVGSLCLAVIAGMVRKLSLPERLRISAQSAWNGIWQSPSPLG